MSDIAIQIEIMRSKQRLNLSFSCGTRQVVTAIDTGTDRVGQITGYLNGKAWDLFTLDEALDWLEEEENNG